MSKYRILEVPQPDGSNSYEIQVLELKVKKVFWRFNNHNDKVIEIWHLLDNFGNKLWFRIHSPTPPPLSHFKTLQKAKDYLEYLKKESKVVFETEI